MRSLREAIARVAPIPSSVLIVGESGTGKELVARELHRLGRPGAKAPLVAVNSAALPEQLVESELFGHERGAFTGADRLRRGAFENAGRWHALPRRDRRAAAAGAGEAASRARRADGDAGRRRPRHPGHGAHRRGHQPRPRARGRRRTLSPGSLLSPQRPYAAGPAAARPALRYPGSRRLICFARSPRTSASGRRRSRPRRSRCSQPTIGGRTTSGSCETAWSG